MTAVPKRQQAQAQAFDNVDPREDLYYHHLAARWWDTSGPSVGRVGPRPA